ncbi:nucleotide-diphospho-sugar transferase [Basidiobolus meristosporus CBS 931.73]|uniref:Translation initiation factor eIF2B subunit epsilon n=1 Tax=Basidiobolus meristosporus CBS 931.73 TaxID=1314790 RepID=A0A1Y1XPP7_9FUNG|nr:nucleotide-diphospho-sugar transferase [Basidiobolus meristosporus CBS 931.73]|eukprot:ORX87729.1 nucleotide-diphospho-sugar transferase [Basidiobolus meristosporus CBS 931.73]
MGPVDRNKSLDSEEVLQAVILADSFNERFMPLTLNKPRCLLPLCNIPLIEYTLEALAVAGVQEIFIFCCAHSDLIKKYLADSRWKKPSAYIRVEVVVVQECYSIGDAMRELDAKSIVKNDFILVNGDVVFNIDLTKALEKHREIRQADKNAIMTMVVRQASPLHPARAKGEDGVFVLDSKSEECVYYESVEAYPRKKRFAFDTEIFEKHPEIQIRNDLIDCQIDICSVEVPALFTENFDYQSMRRDFVHGILTSDILGKTIYCNIIQDEYAARVCNSQLYEVVSKDILSRWTYPMVLEANILEGQSYKYSRGHIYKEDNVVLARSCTLGEKVAIGSGTEIAENAKISNCVIGRNCRIGPNVVIDGAYLWDGVVINANCKVVRSILANNVVLHEGVSVEKGCILAEKVEVGPQITLKELTKLSLEKRTSEFGDSDEEDGEESQGYDSNVVGTLGRGYVWVDQLGDDGDEDPRNVEVADLARDLANIYLSDEESAASDAESEASDVSSLDEPQDDDFNREAIQTLERAFADSLSVDIASLELNTLRMAYDASFHDVRSVLIPAVLKQVDLNKFQESLKQLLARWSPLIKKSIHSEDDQIDALVTLQEFCADSEPHSKLFLFALRFFYQFDLVEEDSVIEWYNLDTDDMNEQEKKLRQMATPFITWLEEADEDSDEDDEDDDE